MTQSVNFSGVAGQQKVAQNPQDELATFLETMSGPSSQSPNNPLNQQAIPSANQSNPSMNPNLPGAYTNPSNLQLNPNLPGSLSNPSNPEYNPNLPGSQTNPSSLQRNPGLPDAYTNPANPQFNPHLPGSLTNPSNPIHNPGLPDPSEIPPPQGVSPDASLPPSRWGSWHWADNYTQDTREWPDPTEPRASKPPEQQGCTCHEEDGQAKLDCPIHGLNATDVDLDHTWSLPQAQPVGYAGQDTPRNWTQAVSSAQSGNQQVEHTTKCPTDSVYDQPVLSDVVMSKYDRYCDKEPDSKDAMRNASFHSDNPQFGWGQFDRINGDLGRVSAGFNDDVIPRLADNSLIDQVSQVSSWDRLGAIVPVKAFGSGTRAEEQVIHSVSRSTRNQHKHDQHRAQSGHEDDEGFVQGVHLREKPADQDQQKNETQDHTREDQKEFIGGVHSPRIARSGQCPEIFEPPKIGQKKPQQLAHSFAPGRPAGHVGGINARGHILDFKPTVSFADSKEIAHQQRHSGQSKFLRGTDKINTNLGQLAATQQPTQEGAMALTSATFEMFARPKGTSSGAIAPVSDVSSHDGSLEERIDRFVSKRRKTEYQKQTTNDGEHYPTIRHQNRKGDQPSNDQQGDEGQPENGECFRHSNRLAASAPHFNRWSGLPCRCPWHSSNRPFRIAAIHEAGQHFNKLRKTNDKRLRTPEGQAFLDQLEQSLGEQYESLAPYMAQRWKKGEIDNESLASGWYPLRSWHQWYEARQHPLRRGVNVMDPNFSIHAMNRHSRDFQNHLDQERELKGGLSHGETVHQFPNGWSIKQLTAPGQYHGVEEAMEAEGRAMGHCLGSDDQPYKRAAREGLIDAYSLRDPKGWPHATWHYNSDGSLAEKFGREDSHLKPEYQAMLDEWGAQHGINTGMTVGNQEDIDDEYIELPAADSVDTYLDLHGGNGMETEYIPQGARYGPETELIHQTPEWSNIANSYFDPDSYAMQFNYQTQPRTRWVDPQKALDERREVFEHALNNGHLGGLHQAISEYPVTTPQEQAIKDEWDQWTKPYYHPLTGEFVPHERHGVDPPISEQFQQPLFADPGAYYDRSLHRHVQQPMRTWQQLPESEWWRNGRTVTANPLWEWLKEQDPRKIVPSQPYSFSPGLAEHSIEQSIKQYEQEQEYVDPLAREKPPSVQPEPEGLLSVNKESRWRQNHLIASVVRPEAGTPLAGPNAQRRASAFVGPGSLAGSRVPVKGSYDHEQSLIETATTLVDQGSDIHSAANWLEEALVQAGREPYQAQQIVDDVFMRRGKVAAIPYDSANPNPTGLPRPIGEHPQGFGPIPWSQGEMGFGQAETERLNDARAHGLCLLCGEPVSQGKVFADLTLTGDPFEVYTPRYLTTSYVVDGGALHDRCATITAAHCPHIKEALQDGRCVVAPYMHDTTDLRWQAQPGSPGGWLDRDDEDYDKASPSPPPRQAHTSTLGGPASDIDRTGAKRSDLQFSPFRGDREQMGHKSGSIGLLQRSRDQVDALADLALVEQPVQSPLMASESSFVSDLSMPNGLRGIVSPLRHIGDGIDKHASIRQAVMTPNQQRRLREELAQPDRYGPENTNVMHTFDDGWTIHHLPTWNEVGREGAMMHHCWEGAGEAWEARPYDTDPYGGPDDPRCQDLALSLRDPDGWPHVSFNYDPKSGVAYEFGGHGGYPEFKEEYAKRINDWGRAKGVSGTGFEEWGLEDPFDRFGIESRIAANQIMYHVAPQEARDSIEQYGLDATRSLYDRWGQGSGLYAFGDLDEAKWYRDLMTSYDNEPMDIWAFEPTTEISEDHGLTSDPDQPTSSGYHSQPIPPERIRRVAKTATEDEPSWWNTYQPIEHDYMPDAYDIREDHWGHPLLTLAQQRMDQLAKLPDTPFERGHVFPAYLDAARNPSGEDAAGVYARGTYNEPVVMVDVDAHQDPDVISPEDEMRRTVDHEVAHAIQEHSHDSIEPWQGDEDEAEGWQFPPFTSNNPSEQYLRDEVPVEGYDPEQMGPEDPNALFTLGHVDLRRVPWLEPADGEAHERESLMGGNYYPDMYDAVANGAVPPLVATEHPGGELELHDGWHRASMALHQGMTHFPAYISRPKLSNTSNNQPNTLNNRLEALNTLNNPLEASNNLSIPPPQSPPHASPAYLTAQGGSPSRSSDLNADIGYEEASRRARQILGQARLGSKVSDFHNGFMPEVAEVKTQASSTLERPNDDSYERSHASQHSAELGSDGQRYIASGQLKDGWVIGHKRGHRVSSWSFEGGLYLSPRSPNGTDGGGQAGPIFGVTAAGEDPIEIWEGTIPGHERPGQDGEYFVRRRPFYYWPNFRKMFIGQPGTHHDTIDDEVYENPDHPVAPIYRSKAPVHLGEMHLTDPENPQIDYNRFGRDPDEADVVSALQQMYPNAQLRSKFRPGSHLGSPYEDSQTSWHLTDNPRFELDPSYVPEDNALAINQRTQPGLYTGNPERWFNGYNYVRPYVAEIEHPPTDAGRWGGENFLPAEMFPQSHIKRVIPTDEWVREEFGEPGWLEENEHPRAWNQPLTTYPDYHYQGPDVREMSPEEHTRHQERADRYIREVRPYMLTRYDKNGDPVPFGHPDWEHLGRVTKTADWDPTTCEHCGGLMTDPQMVGHKWMNHCTYCGHYREVSTASPLLKQQLQNWPPYPESLKSVGPERAWMGKVGTMTLPQEQRAWTQIRQEQGYEPRSQKVWVHPSGWSVQRHPTYGDMKAVGKSMRNCWQSAGNAYADFDDQEMGHNPGSQYHYEPHAVHDPYDIPRIAFFTTEPNPNFPNTFRADQLLHEIVTPLGARNTDLHMLENSESRPYLEAFADEQGYDLPPTYRSSKIADLYHVAPTTERERIRQHGLQPSRPALNERWHNPDDWGSTGTSAYPVDRWLERQPEGVYVTDDPDTEDSAASAAQYMRDSWGEGVGWTKQDPAAFDIWRVPKEQVQEMGRDPIVDDSAIIPHVVYPELVEGGPEEYGPWPKRGKLADFHVAPTQRRKLIEQQGLLQNAERLNQESEHPQGVYVWGDPEVAWKYRGQGPNMYRDMDMWQVNTEGLPLQRDSWFDTNRPDRAQDFPGGQYYQGDIPPERVTPYKMNPWFNEEHPHRAWDLKEGRFDRSEVTGDNRSNAQSSQAFSPSQAKDADFGSYRQALAQGPEGDEEAPLEPFFPSLDDAIEANQTALAMHGQSNHVLLRPEALQSALGRPEQYWHYTESLPQAAAALAHGVGQAQAFEDGNKRTAYWLTHHFLHENGLGHIAPSDDEELADHLIGYGEGTHQRPDTAAMFEDRLAKWPRMAFVKMADKFHDFLRNPKARPDLQTPEARGFLNHLERVYLNDKTDALMPWLTREWKKGRIHLPTMRVDQHSGRLQVADPDLSLIYPEILHPAVIDHWADFLQSNHPVRRQLGDIMQHDVHSFPNLVAQWDEAMANEARQQALQGGQVVHRTPDDWTVRQLTTPEELKAEGEAMGNCVGSYGDPVQRGSSLIYSLRDPQGVPHVTTEIEPTRHEWVDHRGEPHRGEIRMTGDNPTYPVPHNGTIVQIAGQANQEPKDEYKQRMRHWFESFPGEERPQWDPWEMDYGYYNTGIDSVDRIEEEHLDPSGTDAYGLRRPKPAADYGALLDSTLSPSYYRPGVGLGRQVYEPDAGEKVYQLARVNDQIPQLASAMTTFSDENQNNFDHWRDLNEHHLFRPALEDTDPNELLTPEEIEDAHLQAQDDEEREMAKDHPGMQANSHLWNLLRPHWNETTRTYENEPVKETFG